MNDPFVVRIFTLAIRAVVLLLALTVVTITLALFMRVLTLTISEWYAAWNAVFVGFNHSDIGVQCVLSGVGLFCTATGLYNQLKKLHRMRGAE